MPLDPDPPQAEPSPVRRPLSGFVMLLVGLLAGIAVATAAGVTMLGIGLATVGEAEEVIQPEAAPTEAEAEAAASTNPDVPEECVRAAEYSIAVDEGLDEIARGAGEEDALALQETFDALQDARDEADGAADTCLELAGQAP